jgi:hypothetical protein
MWPLTNVSSTWRRSISWSAATETIPSRRRCRWSWNARNSFSASWRSLSTLLSGRLGLEGARAWHGREGSDCRCDSSLVAHYSLGGCQAAPRFPCSASATALGFCAATRRSASAGPSGVRRPCSQFCSVATLTPIIRAAHDTRPNRGGHDARWRLVLKDHAAIPLIFAVHPLANPVQVTNPCVS